MQPTKYVCTGGWGGGVVWWGGEGVEGGVCVAQSVAAGRICEKVRERKTYSKREGITEQESVIV